MTAQPTEQEREKAREIVTNYQLDREDGRAVRQMDAIAQALADHREASIAPVTAERDAIEDAIRARSKRFRTFDDPRERSRYMALALAGEVGELCNLVKKEWRGDPKGLDGKALLDEASDVFVYWTLLCEANGWRIIDVMRHANDKAERRILALEAERASLTPPASDGEEQP